MKKPQHFSGAPTMGGAGQEAMYEALYNAAGKTVERVRFGDAPSPDTETDHGEYIVFEFSDGSVLNIKTASNAEELADLSREREPLKQSDVMCSFEIEYVGVDSAG
jgi:hypothetical protein